MYHVYQVRNANLTVPVNDFLIDPIGTSDFLSSIGFNSLPTQLMLESNVQEGTFSRCAANVNLRCLAP